jgi:hypothetical protein
MTFLSKSGHTSSNSRKQIYLSLKCLLCTMALVRSSPRSKSMGQGRMFGH